MWKIITLKNIITLRAQDFITFWENYYIMCISNEPGLHKNGQNEKTLCIHRFKTPEKPPNFVISVFQGLMVSSIGQWITVLHMFVH